MSTVAPRDARAATLAALGTRTFDVLVIGGGITGCGIARDAALRGLDVALVEKDDFASGTSSRSSRLVHGGVRYLEHGHLYLVFESSAERRRLLRLAPHLVHPLAFTWPVYAGARVARWKLTAGLFLYDALAMFRNVGRHKRLDVNGVLAREPRLRRDGLRGGAQYFDASTDDARLTLANVLDARDAGATVANHVEAQTLRVDDGAITGALVVDRLTGAAIEVRARVVVNATGPWSDDVRGLAGSARAAVRGSKGVHIVLPRDRVGNNGALTLLSPIDGRVLFVLPDGEYTIVGTTDTFTSESPDEVRATVGDVQYLLDAANAFFPEALLVVADVVAAWAGIRPLLPSTDASPGAASREHEITVGENGLVSITGGKLTTFRVMAAEVVDVVLRRLGRTPTTRPTRTRPLRGGTIASFGSEVSLAAEKLGDRALATHLVGSFGSQWRDVCAAMHAAPDGAERLTDQHTIGELRYSVVHELACTPGDFLLRRTRVAFERPDHGGALAPRVAREMASLLGWSQHDAERALVEFDDEIRRVFDVGPGAT